MDWLGAGAGIGTSLLNNFFGIIGGDYARQKNYEIGEKQAQNADARTRRLYHDLYSIPAQMRQLKEAGLSPSIFYGDAGGLSGQAGAQGGAASESAHVYGLDPLTMSQIKLNEAQATKLNAEATKESETTAPTIAKLWAEAGAAEASSALNVAQTEAVNLANYIVDSTKEFSIYEAASKAEKESAEAWKAFSEAKKADLEWKFDKETYSERVEMVSANKAVLIAEAMFKNAQKELTEQEKEESIARIEKMISDTFQGWANVDINQQNADTYEKWINGKLPTIEKELELEAKRLGVEKTRMYLNFSGDVIKGASAAIGAFMLKGKGTGGSNPVFLDKGAPTSSKSLYSDKARFKESTRKLYDY